MAARPDRPDDGSPLAADERAVSTTLGYALSLGVTALLITGLLFAGGTFLDDEREQATRGELRVVGEQVATGISAADRLVRTTGTGSVTVTMNLPATVVGSTYTVSVTDVGTDPRVALSVQNPSVTVEVDVETTTDLAASSVSGGDLRIRYDAAADELVVEND